jgi:hypothetical protein
MVLMDILIPMATTRQQLAPEWWSGRGSALVSAVAGGGSVGVDKTKSKTRG